MCIIYKSILLNLASHLSSSFLTLPNTYPGCTHHPPFLFIGDQVPAHTGRPCGMAAGLMAHRTRLFFFFLLIDRPSLAETLIGARVIA